MAATNDRLAKYRRPGAASAVAPLAQESAVAPATGKQPYQAYALSKEAKRHLEIRFKFPDPAQCPLNTLIVNIEGEWRMGLGLTLTYGTLNAPALVIDIVGENLQELFRMVQDWKVEWIAEFDPKFHEPPADDKAPFIKSITVHKHRMETPPPPEKRH
jgi:hypothetical protein